MAGHRDRILAIRPVPLARTRVTRQVRLGWRRVAHRPVLAGTPLARRRRWEGRPVGGFRAQKPVHTGPARLAAVDW